MKFLALCLMIISTSIHAITQEDAKQLINFNEQSFSDKELINNPELCSFHNSLIKISKTKKELIKCNNRQVSPDTKDGDLTSQLNNLNQSMAVVELVHPEAEATPASIQDFAVQKMRMQGFGQ